STGLSGGRSARSNSRRIAAKSCNWRSLIRPDWCSWRTRLENALGLICRRLWWLASSCSSLELDDSPVAPLAALDGATSPAAAPGELGAAGERRSSPPMASIPLNKLATDSMQSPQASVLSKWPQTLAVVWTQKVPHRERCAF